jgi:hypothetical protein
MIVSACAGGAAPTPAPTLANARCQLVDAVTVGELALALDPGITIRNVYFVRSNDYQDTLFMSGDLEGPGLDGTGDIATFAIDQAQGANSSFYEIDPLATQYSGWIPGSQKDYSMTDDGAAESAECAHAG